MTELFIKQIQLIESSDTVVSFFFKYKLYSCS